MVRGQSGEREHHSRRGTEVRFGGAALDEAYGAVKRQRVRIGGNLQALCSPRLGSVSRSAGRPMNDNPDSKVR